MRPIAVPPSLTKSLRSPDFPMPITMSREAFRRAGATMSRADPDLPVKRSEAAARATRSPVGSSALRVAPPNRTPSSANTTRTPLAGGASGAKASLGPSAMEGFLSDGFRREFHDRGAPLAHRPKTGEVAPPFGH